MPRILIFLLTILILGFGFYFISKEKEIMIEETETKLEVTLKGAEGKISIITCYDNYLADSRLKTGWGFSVLIKSGNQNILFDTGADSETLLFNMENMERDPKKVNTIVLSHIHGDHIGGLKGFLKKNANLTVYIPASFPDLIRKEIESYGAKYKDIKGTEKISEGVYSTGELYGPPKEQSLIVNSKKGLIVITGCAHPGIVNIVKKAKEMFPNEDVYLVLGGFHLTGASDSELKSIINDFRKLDVQKAAPCHCSGDRCRELFKEEYGDNFIENGVGKIIEI